MVIERDMRSTKGLLRQASSRTMPSLRACDDLAQQQLERQRLVKQVALALELCIGRQQVVLATHLHAMAGVVDHRHVGALRLDAEFPHRTAEARGNPRS